jgi:hypothetical protein
MIEFIDLPEFDPILAARAAKVHVRQTKRAYSYRAVNEPFTMFDRCFAEGAAATAVRKDCPSRGKPQQNRMDGKSKSAEAKSKHIPSANRGLSVV